MEHAIFIRKEKAELMGDKLMRNWPSINEAGVHPYYIRNELKGYKLKVRRFKSWEYVTEDML